MEKIAQQNVCERDNTALYFIHKAMNHSIEDINYCKLKINCRRYLDKLSGNQLSWYDYLDIFVSEASIEPKQMDMVRACWELMNKIY